MRPLAFVGGVHLGERGSSLRVNILPALVDRGLGRGRRLLVRLRAPGLRQLAAELLGRILEGIRSFDRRALLAAMAEPPHEGRDPEGDDDPTEQGAHVADGTEVASQAGRGAVSCYDPASSCFAKAPSVPGGSDMG